MLIYQWSGNGRIMMQGVSEYIIMTEDINDFLDDYVTEDKAIEAHTAPGFTFDKKYDTDIDTDYSTLPLNQMIVVKY